MLPCTCVSLTCWNAAVGYFFYECTASSKKERGSQGQLTFRLMARSWRAAVLSLTRWHEPASVCHTAVVKQWHFDESSVSAYWCRVYDTIPSLSAIRWHILRNCQNTFEVVQKLSASSNSWRGGCRRSEWRRSLFWYTWHHSIMMAVCWYFPPQMCCWQRGGGVVYLRWCWNWRWNGDLTFL